MAKFCIIFMVFVLAVSPLYARANPQPQENPPPAKAEAQAPQPQSGLRNVSGLPIPRFVSLASDKVFVRTGPALRYPIKWVYQRKSLPVEVVQEFDTWRKIRDMDGDDGWVHQSLLSGQRAVIVKGEQNLPLFAEAADNSRVESLLEPGVVATADRCAGSWCYIEAQGISGYAQRKFLWGIYDTEDFN